MIKRPKITILEGDNIDILPTIASESIDAVITDPPYNLSFMRKGWDKDTVAFYPEFWEEVLRTMKPGAHLLAFGHSRMFHRLVCAIEDAGFEIRDTIMWLYGSGFPKSLDVSKAIDKAAGAEREVVKHATGKPSGSHRGRIAAYSPSNPDDYSPPITAPATPKAAQWQEWGTALKPAFEPIIVARKPLSEKTMAANVLRYGIGAINVDACRVEANIAEMEGRSGASTPNNIYGEGISKQTGIWEPQALGRWPANVIHDGSDEVEAAFAVYSDRNTASRFFYSAKASNEDRFDSKHPTVKPLALMQWLCNLITPPDGTILDCFAGTGSTLLAAKSLNFNAIGIEKEHEYVLDIQNKLKQRGFFI